MQAQSPPSPLNWVNLNIDLQESPFYSQADYWVHCWKRSMWCGCRNAFVGAGDHLHLQPHGGRREAEEGDNGYNWGQRWGWCGSRRNKSLWQAQGQNTEVIFFIYHHIMGEKTMIPIKS